MSALEVKRLRRDCSELYQVIGTMAEHCPDAGYPAIIKALDNASAAAAGVARPHDDLLPFVLPEPAVMLWLPIETAPKDGSRIDAWFVLNNDHGARWVKVCWSDDHQRWYDGPTDQGANSWIATHWMPQPAPPSIAKQERKS